MQQDRVWPKHSSQCSQEEIMETYLDVLVLYSKIPVSRPSQNIFLLATSKIDTPHSLSKLCITVPVESGYLTDKDLKALSHIRGHPRNESSILTIFTAQNHAIEKSNRINSF
jgi:hypothetical protein